MGRGFIPLEKSSMFLNIQIQIAVAHEFLGHGRYTISTYHDRAIAGYPEKFRSILFEN